MASRAGNAPLDAELMERRRILPLQKVAELTSLSEDTLKRNFPDKVKRLSARRLGMAITDVLAIGNSSSFHDTWAAFRGTKDPNREHLYHDVLRVWTRRFKQPLKCWITQQGEPRGPLVDFFTVCVKPVL